MKCLASFTVAALLLCGCRHAPKRPPTPALGVAALRTVTLLWSQSENSPCNLDQSTNLRDWNIVCTTTNYAQTFVVTNACCFFIVSATNNGYEVFQPYKPASPWATEK